MTRTLSFDHTPKELALRRTGTFEVALLWSRRTHRAAVKLEDEATGVTFELAVGEADDPLDVFDHPYAYAAARGVSTDPELAQGQRPAA
ncbi:MAG TPA: hypothetical protein VF327_12655 [Gaiellaceae bacterium]